MSYPVTLNRKREVTPCTRKLVARCLFSRFSFWRVL